MGASLIRVNVDPLAGEDENVRKTLLTRLNALDDETRETIHPILLRWNRARFDIELICVADDLSALDDFLMDVVRSVEGVNNTNCHIMSSGFVFPGGMARARMARAAGQAFIGATVDLDVQPGTDRQVFEQLYDLTEADDLRKFYVFKDFASAHSDMSLSLIGPDQATVDEYVQRFVRSVDGVVDTQTVYTHGWAMLATDEELEALLAPFTP